MITTLLIAAGALYLLNRKQSGIGKVERIKRRIYKEVSLAQSAGVDFSKKYAELSKAELDALEHIGKDVVMWKQSKRSIESGKPYTESYYGSLRRAWNAVSGIQGIGATDYPVYDRDGNVCLTWTDVTEHIEHEPEAKTLLALPPHIEEKKPKTKRAKKEKAEEDLQRQNFASMFIRAYMDGDGWGGIKIDPYMQNFLNRNFTQNGKTIKVGELFIYAWGEKKYKIKKSDNNVSFICVLDGKQYYAPLWREDGKIFEILDEYWKMYLEDSGWRENEDKIDDIRKELLDRAKLMRIHVPDDQIKFYEEKGLLDETKHPYRDKFISGENRYQAMDLINWILWVHQHYDRGGDTYYPKYAFDTKEDALRWSGGKMKGNGFKIIPVWDVPIEKITGIL